jgi:hypothetical protein
MYTADDFQKKIRDASLANETVAALYHAGDPRIYRFERSVAQMFGMLSQQIEVAAMEVFEKSRDTTVLADAALKGLLFTAEPAIIRIKADNLAHEEITIVTGRQLIDANGMVWSVLNPVTVPATVQGDGNLSSATFTAIQSTTETQTFTVAVGEPFFELKVIPPENDAYISELRVTVNGAAYASSYRFNGVQPEDKVFHVISNEYGDLLIKFGDSGVIGTSIEAGDQIQIIQTLCFGDVRPELGSPVSFDYIQSPNESALNLTVAAIESQGVNPVDIATLRELCKYPSIYDENAVFMGEFDVAVRKRLHHLPFLSVWNEQREELARGPNQDNVNGMFISLVLPDDSTQTVADAFNQACTIIDNADGSYHYTYVEPLESEIKAHINIAISRVHNTDVVIDQIKTLLLKAYGRGAFAVKRGMFIPKNKDVHDMLKKGIPALQDDGADFSLTIEAQGAVLPEMYRYMSRDSITVNASHANYNDGAWGH